MAGLLRCAPLLLLLGPSCGGADPVPAAPKDRPSVVFISVDTLTARHMSLYGYERLTTPALDTFAERATVFERCWANAPWTVPSYMSQFTGLNSAAFLHPSKTGTAHWDLALPQAHRTMAEYFQDAGYRTAAFIDNPNILADRGFAQGFDLYDDSATKLDHRHKGGGIDHITPIALDWLDQGPEGQPDFLFFQVLDVHGPYVAAGEFEGFFADQPGPVSSAMVPVALSDELIFGAIPHYIAQPVLEEGQLEVDRAILVDDYDEGIRAVDKALGKLLQQLQTRGILDDAIVIISADHGESMGEHDSYFSHVLNRGELLHVPLLIKLPGQAEGRRVQGNAQLIDLLPTMLELADLPDPGGLHGQSLVASLDGAELASVPSLSFNYFRDSESIVDGDWKLLVTNPNLANSKLIGFLSAPRTRAWLEGYFPGSKGLVYGTAALPFSVLDHTDQLKLHEDALQQLQGPYFSLHNIAEDPGELVDLAGQYPERVQTLWARLQEIRNVARERHIVADEVQELDAEAQALLDKLGYK
ncbi:MAG: sulfatase [Planctomycetota bacterium]|nr:sulfatase [Planctomycetota bacterium]MDG2142198.1 sulfatase [Planctomycetota bacterium]